jgi:exodeoxyribonuclease-3
LGAKVQKEYSVTEKQLKLFSWNVNGIRALEKKGFLTWLQSCGADIVLLQETKCSPEQLSDALCKPEGFYAEWCAAEKKGYSGVATFSRVPATTTRGLGEARFDGEGRVLISTFPNFTLINTYFPSGNSGPERVAFKLDFYKHFLQVVRPYLERGDRVIIAGDVNTAYAEIDLARPRENRNSWWSQVTFARERNIGWRLDYFLVSPNLLPYVADADIHPEVLGSDHCPISLTLSLPESSAVNW